MVNLWLFDVVLPIFISKTNRKITWGNKISEANKGRKHSEETKQKQRLAKLGKKYSEERNQKLINIF